VNATELRLARGCHQENIDKFIEISLALDFLPWTLVGAGCGFKS
jgi:hypothetical protein